VAWSGELGYGVRPPEKGQAFEDIATVPSADHEDHGHDDHGHDHGHDDHDQHGQGGH
jgi:hypothetical protein